MSNDLTRADVEKAVRIVLCGDPDALSVRAQSVTDAVWALVSGDDPALFVVRESGLPEVEHSLDGQWFVNEEFAGHKNITPESKRRQRDVALSLAARHEAVARAIEAEQAVDPVDELAQQIEAAVREATAEAFDVIKTMTGGGIDKKLVDDMLAGISDESRRLAAHVLGQESDR